MAKAKIAKQKVTFSFVAPDAKTVQVAGDFTDWDKDPLSLKRDKSGTWKKVVSLAPGEYEYRLLVDGQWQDDPECGIRRANQHGSQNCVRIVNAS